jgi:hypothetical protein
VSNALAKLTILYAGHLVFMHAMTPNDADHRPCANNAQHETLASSRGSVHSICSALSSTG